MKIERTHQEILKKIDTSEDDLFGTFKSDLTVYLPYKLVKDKLRAGVTKRMWDKTHLGVKPPLDEIKEYLEFAWDKADGCRGLSAARSMSHMKAWLWLAGIDDLDWVDNYTMYGKPQLVAISVAVGFNWIEHDNGPWVSKEGGMDLKTTAMVRAWTRKGDLLKAQLELIAAR